jgi:hypothetical protein
LGGLRNYFGDVEGITPHFPFIHPHWPAPQSIGPSQLIVHITLHTLFSALLMQLVGWQHSAGTQSSLTVQLCEDTGIVVTTGVPTGDGETVTTGGLPVVVHPLTRIITPMVTRRADKSQKLFRAIVSGIAVDLINS